MPTLEYPHIEDDLANTLGLSREIVREVRIAALEKNRDWCLVADAAGRRVCLSETGRAKLLDRLSVQVTGGPEKKPLVTPQRPHLVELHAWPFEKQPNTRILVCHWPGKNPEDPQNRVRVRVRSTANFARQMRNGSPMVVRAYQVAGDLYDIDPLQRLPRSKGWW